jgi:hypothetical protein
MAQMRKDTASAFGNILQAFSGEDGGAGFIAIQHLVQVMDRQASEGDIAAEEIVTLVKRMSRLIDVAKKQMYG